jgi:hypothetical protein
VGKISPQVNKDRPGGNPGDQRQIQSLQKDRVNMDSLRPLQRAPEACFASHFRQVYRPIDNEKLKSQASEEPETLQLCGCVPSDGVSTPHLFHEKPRALEKPALGDQK